MAVSFPQNPSDGDLFVSGDLYFEFTNNTWNALTTGISTVTNFTVTDELKVNTITSDQLNITYGKNSSPLVANDDGSVSIGSSTALVSTFSENSVLIGHQAALNTASINDSVIIGDSAGALITSGINSCTFIGRSTGVRATGIYNTYLGAVSGQGDATCTGSYNTGLGGLALVSIQGTSRNNTAVGSASLNDLTIANDNACFGVLSGEKNTTGSKNTFIGFAAGKFTETGDGNVAIGWNSTVPDTKSGHVALGYNVGTDPTQTRSLAIGYGGTAWLIGDEDFGVQVNSLQATQVQTTYIDPGATGGEVASQTEQTNTGIVTLASGTNATVFQLNMATTSFAEFQFMIRSSDGTIKSSNGYAYTVDGTNITLVDLFGTAITFSTFNNNTVNIGTLNTNRPAFVASGLNLQFLVANNASSANVTSTWVINSRVISFPLPPV